MFSNVGDVPIGQVSKSEKITQFDSRVDGSAECENSVKAGYFRVISRWVFTVKSDMKNVSPHVDISCCRVNTLPVKYTSVNAAHVCQPPPPNLTHAVGEKTIRNHKQEPFSEMLRPLSWAVSHISSPKWNITFLCIHVYSHHVHLLVDQNGDGRVRDRFRTKIFPEQFPL